MLPADVQKEWSMYASINSNSGVVHPLVHAHPISGRKSIWLHLGWTGAVIRRDAETQKFRVLEEDEMVKLFNDYNNILNKGFPDNGGNWSISYKY